MDDDEQELSVLQFLLETYGYRVLPATNGHEAIALFSEAPEINLVLADELMPQMSGHQVVKQLKEIDAQVPMVLLGDPATNERGGADVVLEKKTLPASELLVRVKVLSARHRGPRPGSGGRPKKSAGAC